MNITLINGAPRSGKDTLGQMLLEASLGTGLIMKFAREVKERTHAALGLYDFDGDPLPHDAFEAEKDDPYVEGFNGVTPRQAYIQFSEGFAKPLFGPSIFGEWLAESIDRLNRGRIGHVIVTDSGFVEEAAVLVDQFGAENIRLIQVRRPGYSFAGDSRSYVDGAELGVATFSILNTGTMEDLRACASRLNHSSAEGSPSVF